MAASRYSSFSEAIDGASSSRSLPDRCALLALDASALCRPSAYPMPRRPRFRTFRNHQAQPLYQRDRCAPRKATSRRVADLRVLPHAACGAKQIRSGPSAAVEPQAVGRHLHALHLHFARSRPTRRNSRSRPRRQLQAVPVVPRRHAWRIGNVNVLNGAKSNPPTAHPNDGTGAGGRCRSDRGTDHRLHAQPRHRNLTNDHPISFTYDRPWPRPTANCAPSLRTTHFDASPTYPAARPCRRHTRLAAGHAPKLPLESRPDWSSAPPATIRTCAKRDPLNGQRPSSCASTASRRRRRAPAASSDNGDIFCLACHDKAAGRPGPSRRMPIQQWPTSCTTTTAATLREFPTTAPGMPVWKAACLNCHDTHYRPGRRAGCCAKAPTAPRPKAGGNSAIEETCYQCHQLRTNLRHQTPMVLTSVTTVPEHQGRLRAHSRPHADHDTDQQWRGRGARHRDTDGAGHPAARTLSNRPTLLGGECDRQLWPQQYPPRRMHRLPQPAPRAEVQPRRRHRGHSTSVAQPMETTSPLPCSAATFGVEPNYLTATDTKFGRLPQFPASSLRCGSGSGASNCSATVTKEYQIRLKCHSNYAYTDTDDPVGDAYGDHVQLHRSPDHRPGRHHTSRSCRLPGGQTPSMSWPFG